MNDSTYITHAELNEILSGYVTEEEHDEVLSRFKSYRNKAVTGFLIALVGVAIAIGLNSKALTDGATHGKEVRGTICTIFREQDVNSVKELPLTAKLLKIPLSVLEPFEEDNLRRQAAYRAKLGPSIPASACSSTPVLIRPTESPNGTGKH